eukprot:CAMPEP_0204552516 /NCGR_PEP_ID=MMETSP0661-20131031/26655_1 /ASSEMBLY_ACC=CAM_ASM_000606 /TAXON_ID=109239 /ORGANISM="Alexandrium margalefi, Strain AMGDE01CS-322" /LENGTH=54 /DNA_ID=CAMNT_0051559529 /DNA_START=12 /DNA_END=174 /DNA_ORIENTATION=+
MVAEGPEEVHQGPLDDLGEDGLVLDLEEARAAFLGARFGFGFLSAPLPPLALSS